MPEHPTHPFRHSFLIARDGLLTLRLPTPGLFDHDQIEGIIAAAREPQYSQTFHPQTRKARERTPHIFPTLERRPRTTRKVSPAPQLIQPPGVLLVRSVDDDQIIEPSGSGTQLMYYHPMFDEYRPFLPQGEGGKAKDGRKRDKAREIRTKISRGAKNSNSDKGQQGGNGLVGGGLGQKLKRYISIPALVRKF